MRRHRGSGPLLVFIAAATKIDVAWYRTGQELRVIGFSGRFGEHTELLPRSPRNIAAVSIAEGHFTRHLRPMRGLYAERQAALMEAATQFLAGRFDVRRTETGIHLVGWLPEGTDDRLIAQRAAAAGIIARPVSSFRTGPSAARGSCSASRPYARRRSATRCSGSPRSSHPAQAPTRRESRHLKGAARRGFVTQRNAHWIRRADVALARLAATAGS